MRTGSDAGFTMPELLVVIAVLVGLLAVGFPAYRALQARGKVDAARAVVAAAAAIAREPTLRLDLPSAWRDGRPAPSAVPVAAPLFDLNGDGLLDGDLAVGAAATSIAADPLRRADRSAYAAFADETQLAAALAGVGQAGFARRTGFAAAKSLNARGQVIDAWGTPLRYLYAPLGRDPISGTPACDRRFFIPAVRDAAIASVQADLAPRLGAPGFAVWSAGPDRRDGTADDIVSTVAAP